MIKNYLKFKTLSDKQNIEMKNQQFNIPVNKMHFTQIIDDNDNIDDIQLDLEKSKYFVIDKKILDFIEYFIICFKDQLIIIEKSKKLQLKNLFSFITKEHIFYFLSESYEDFCKIIPNISDDSNHFPFLSIEIDSFKPNINLSTKYRALMPIWSTINTCLSAYFIIKSYYKCKVDRVHDFISNIENFVCIEEKEFDINEFISLRSIGSGSNTTIYLYYHIKTEQLFAVKARTIRNDKYLNREINHYRRIRHPLFGRYYGTIKKSDTIYLVLEYIDGPTFLSINGLDLNQKMKTINEMLNAFDYLHKNDFIYRDLKPNNVILNENNRIVLIDFDGMINERDTNSEYTKDFNQKFSAPELSKEDPTVKCDIYSIGKMIYFILVGLPSESNDELFMTNFPDLYSLFISCISENPSERPTITELIQKFTQAISQIQNNEKLTGINQKIIKTEFEKEQILIQQINDITTNFKFDLNIPNNLYNLGQMYYDGKYVKKDTNKAIHYLTLAANKNDPNAQHMLGRLYTEGENVDHDLNKAIYYYTLAANQSFLKSLNNLGFMYYVGKYVKKDIKKAIHYYTLAVDQNLPSAQTFFGVLYTEGKYVKQDITKGIQYLIKAAKQNELNAQHNLGIIYYEGKLVPRNINKAIYYYTLSANQNDNNAQYTLGTIYYEGKFIKQDINKAIHYLTLAADQNNSKAQYLLGDIYRENRFIAQDINKSIHYYTLAAEQNDYNAQSILGNIFYLGIGVDRDIPKAIHYYTLAAYQNEPVSLNNLGIIYSEGKDMKRDMNRAIHCFNLSASQNYPMALYHLGKIYYDGKSIEQDIYKAINYLTLAANQNEPHSQNILGIIYSEGKYIEKDINKAIHYWELAANQNFADAQFNLALLYLEGEYVQKDINKAIHYFTLLANQNNPEAQNNLGNIYYEGKEVNRDINKAIKFYTLAAKQNLASAQLNLANIYYEGKYVKQDIPKAIQFYALAAAQNKPSAQNILGLINLDDKNNNKNINKGIEYLMLAANQNYSISQNHLGTFFYYGKYVNQDINKGINYLILASNQNNLDAQFNLGVIYYKGKYINRDIKKAIHYFTLASNQNDRVAQYKLALIYFKGKYIEQNIKLSLYYLNLSSKNEFRPAQLFLADLYLEGRFVERDVEKSYYLYIEASVVTTNYAKINLGVILKNGFDCIEKNVIKAKEFFKENDDPVSLYNLANLILNENEDNIKEPINFLNKSFSLGFLPSIVLIYLLLIRHFQTHDFEIIRSKVSELSNVLKDLSKTIEENYAIFSKLISESISLVYLYQQYRNANFIYIRRSLFSLENLICQDKTKEIFFKEKKLANQNEEFYKGFGKDLMKLIQ